MYIKWLLANCKLTEELKINPVLQNTRDDALDLVVASSSSWTTAYSRPCRSSYYCKDRVNDDFEVRIIIHSRSWRVRSRNVRYISARIRYTLVTVADLGKA